MMVQEENGSYIPASRLFFPDGLRALRLSCDWPCQCLWQHRVQFHWLPPACLLQTVCPAAPQAGRVILSLRGPSQGHDPHRHQAVAAGITGSSSSSSELTGFNTKGLLPFHLPAANMDGFCWCFSSFVSICRFINLFLTANLLVIFFSNSCS